jgi:hypothetical protein
MPQREFANQKALVAYAEQNDLAYEYEFPPRRAVRILRPAWRMTPAKWNVRGSWRQSSLGREISPRHSSTDPWLAVLRRPANLFSTATTDVRGAWMMVLVIGFLNTRSPDDSAHLVAALP